MLYQLAIYALSQRPPGRATILYPTMNSAARDSVIRIHEPVGGNLRAEVVQRPVNLARLAELVTPVYGISAAEQKHEFALRLLAHPLLSSPSTQSTSSRQDTPVEGYLRP
jgi:hypothetical protein